MTTAWTEPKAIEPSSIPLFFKGQPSVDFDSLSQALSQKLEQEIQLLSASTPLQDPSIVEQYLEGLTSQMLRSDSLYLSPLQGQCHLIYSNEDQQEVLALFLGDHALTSTTVEAFWNLLLAKLLHTSAQLPLLAPFSLRLKQSEPPTSQEGSVLIELKVLIGQSPRAFSLLLDPLLVRSWKEHWQSQARLRKEGPLPPSMQIKLGACAGRLSLSTKMLRSLEVGDWIALDQGYFEGEQPAKVDLYWGRKIVGSGSFESGQVRVDNVRM